MGMDAHLSFFEKKSKKCLIVVFLWYNKTIEKQKLRGDSNDY